MADKSLLDELKATIEAALQPVHEKLKDIAAARDVQCHGATTHGASISKQSNTYRSNHTFETVNMNIAQVNIRSINTSSTLVEHMCISDKTLTYPVYQRSGIKQTNHSALSDMKLTFRSRGTKRGGGGAMTKDHIKVLEIKPTNTTHADIAAVNIYSDTTSFNMPHLICPTR
ncbi:hypothetical protein Bbelb_316630 [Branchiostoma belcheri]|nr:hypothetical protein Bbelb_316630 [Branchiostoma belcheri]